MVADLVSIILPTYNRAYCLPDTMTSLLNQTYTNYEIIVIDDESTDNTAELFATRYANHPKIKYLTRKNGGCGAARNTGLEVAQGEFIAICDSDDLWEPWKLEVQIACLKQLPEVGLIWTDLSAVDPSGKVVHEHYAKVGYTLWSKFSMDELFHKSLRLDTFCHQPPNAAKDSTVYVGNLLTPMMLDAMINIPTQIVRKTIFDQIGVFDASMRAGEDYDFNLRVCAIAPVAFVDVPSIAYRIGAADQLTRPELYAEQARNCLTSIQPMIKNRRDQIKLSNSELRKLLASKYRWLGTSEFESRRWKPARAALAKSLFKFPLQPRVFALMLLTLAPEGIVDAMRSVARKLRNTAAA